MKFDGEKPKRRKRHVCIFDKVRILYRPLWILICDASYRSPDAPYELSYRSSEIRGPHFIRKYPTLDKARDAAKRLQARFAEPGKNPIPVYEKKFENFEEVKSQ